MREVPATEFTRNFGRYREIVQREPLAITSHGRATGYFVSAVEYEEIQRIRALVGRSLAIEDLTEEEIERIASVRMDPGHEHLNALLDEDSTAG